MLKKIKINIKTGLYNNIYGLYASLIVFAILLLMFIVCGVAPFGTNTIMVGDGIDQYLPFMSEYRYKLLNKENMIFSWHVGMGMDFYSIYAYYLTSPFNLLLAMFGKGSLVACANLIWLLKIVIMTFTMSYYLVHKKKDENNGVLVIALSIAYGLSNYVIAYGNNIMWLDCLILLPLIVLGLERVLEGKGVFLYVLSLALAMFCNYYIAFIMCIFLVLYFLAQSFIDVKDFFVKGIKFAICSITSAALTAFLLLPAFLGLMGNNKMSASVELYRYTNIFDLLNNQFFGAEIVVNSFEPYELNVYCGVIVILGIALYCLWDKESAVVRIKKLALLIFMYISCNDELLNYVWHGFHEQKGVPNRFSFMMIFMMLVMTYEALNHIVDYSKQKLFGAGIVALLYVALCCYGTDESIIITPVIITIVLILVYIIGVILESRYKKGLILISLISVIELATNAALAYTNYDFVDVEKIFLTDEKVDKVYEEAIVESDKNNVDMYRTEFVNSLSDGESVWYNMNGISVFTSTVNKSLCSFAKNMGCKYYIAGYFYDGATPLMSALYNMRYAISYDEDMLIDNQVLLAQGDNVYIYENPYVSSLGFSVSANILNWENESGLVFRNQNNFAKLITDVDDMFVAGEYQYSFVEGSVNTYELTFEETGEWYIYLGAGEEEKISVDFGERKIVGDYGNAIIYAGYMEAGHSIYIESDGDISSVNAMMYNEAVFEKVYDDISEHKLRISSIETGYIKGDITVETNELMFTSIPYDKGWEAYVDGEQVEAASFAGAFLVVPMDEGTHTVELIYKPRGLKTGVGISLASLVMIMIYITIKRKYALPK